MRRCLLKLVNVLIVGLLCTVFYSWGSKRFYPSNKPAGFTYGAVHGALMPMALPGLLMGGDPVIYAENNTGRSYKLGYITGINICGFVVFGLTFWSPKPRDQKPKPSQ